MSAKQVIELTRRVSAEAPYDFIRQLAFNTVVGNGDAHAKNYSLVLADDVRLAPLHDSIPTQSYGASHPQLDTTLAMPVAGARRPPEVTTNRWRKLSRVTGVDEERVVTAVHDVARGVVEHAADVYRDVGVRGALLDTIVELQRRNADAVG